MNRQRPGRPPKPRIASTVASIVLVSVFFPGRVSGGGDEQPVGMVMKDDAGQLTPDSLPRLPWLLDKARRAGELSTVVVIDCESPLYEQDADGERILSLQWQEACVKQMSGVIEDLIALGLLTRAKIQFQASFGEEFIANLGENGITHLAADDRVRAFYEALPLKASGSSGGKLIED